jgi:signal transduction histidine kinase
VHPSDQAGLRSFLEKIRMQETQAPEAMEYRVIRSDGGVRWLRLTAKINRRSGDGRKVLSATLQGITERKTLERELLTTIDRERELGRLKTSFLHMVTHEYRTPLGIISSSAQILERYFAKLDEEQRAEHLREIRMNARRLSELMEEVLFIGKTDSGVIVMQPQAVDLKPWLRALANDVVTSLGAEREVEVSVEGGSGRAMLDERLLRHAMTNLVSNALKYSTLDSTVTVAAKAVTGWLTISVRDRGIGIPAEDKAKLFQMFQRASNVGTISGSGLGLVIVKRCVDLHGGTIEIESEPERGTTVTVRFPQPSLAGAEGI